MEVEDEEDDEEEEEDSEAEEAEEEEVVVSIVAASGTAVLATTGDSADPNASACAGVEATACPSCFFVHTGHRHSASGTNLSPTHLMCAHAGQSSQTRHGLVAVWCILPHTKHGGS